MHSNKTHGILSGSIGNIKGKNSNDAAKNAGEVSLGRMGAQLKKMVCA